MTLLQRPPRATTEATGQDQATVLRRLRTLGLAAVAGSLAAFLSLMVISVPVLLAWFAESLSSVSLWQAMGISVDLWALAHRATVLVGQTEVVLAPLLLTVVPLLACRYAVNQVLVDRPETRGALREVSGARAAWQALAGTELSLFVGGYVLSGLLLCVLAGLGQAPVSVASAVPGLVLVPVVAVLWGLWREHRVQEQPTIDRGLRWVEDHTPVLARRGLRPAAHALVILTVGALAVVGLLLVLRWDRIALLYTTLDAGVVGAGVLTLAQAAALPNLTIWAAGWTTGAEVSVGTVTVGWTGSTEGDLPLIPVLGALPEPGPLPTWMWAAIALPLLAGCWVGWRSIAAAPRLASWWAKAQIAGSACLFTSLALGALSLLSSGGMSPGYLSTVGTDALRVTGGALVLLLAGSLTTLSLLHLVRARRLTR